MALRVLADSGCTDGTCPTLWLDEANGDVVVRGYSEDDPTVERDVRIPAEIAAKWRDRLSQL
jgi:hypothetical protein